MPQVQVDAPSRLHFGLFSFGRRTGREFGGVGVMVGPPKLWLKIEPAEEFSAVGVGAERVREFARHWQAYHRIAQAPSCRVQVIEAPPEHSGLGVGTQLALATAAGLNAFAGLPAVSPQELALSVGRSRRSAVGTYGFVLGGMIVEQGKAPGEPVSPLDCRIDFPAAWRFLLVRPLGMSGMYGAGEAAAFDDLPAVSPETTSRLIQIARDQLVPAAATQDFPLFAQSLYEYGRLAGSCFAGVQAGAYNGPGLTKLVRQLRELGAEGVGQSSWGPTIFAILPSQSQAESLAEQIRLEYPAGSLDTMIAAACNDGAQVRIGPFP